MRTSPIIRLRSERSVKKYQMNRPSRSRPKAKVRVGFMVWWWREVGRAEGSVFGRLAHRNDGGFVHFDFHVIGDLEEDG